MVKENLEQVRARIAAAAKRAGRDPAGVRLIAVTKGVPAPHIEEAIACGIQDVGENRVQEAQEKQLILRPFDKLRAGGAKDERAIRWHLIGHLQRNKVKQALELFDCIHSVDSLELVEALDKALRQAQGERRFPMLVQVNVSGEATKCGCTPEETAKLVETIRSSHNLECQGLMTMAPYSGNPESARPFFRRLHELAGRMKLKELSMGMSGDFEAAVEEGATMVRIGTAIFGGRQ